MKRTKLLLLLLITLAGCNVETNEHSKTDAYYEAMWKVEDRLRAPSEAEFPGALRKESHVRRDSNRFFVNSWVDAQNGFGATIRYRFNCWVIFGDSTVRVEDLELNRR